MISSDAEGGHSPADRYVELPQSTTAVVSCTYRKRTVGVAKHMSSSSHGNVVLEVTVQGFDGKARRKEPLGRPRSKWRNGIRKDLMETGWGSVEWIQLAQDRDR
jgi:hypothetical protein